MVIISHAHREGNFRGPTDVMIENLAQLQRPFFLIEHDLSLKGDTLLIRYEADGSKSIMKVVPRSIGSTFRRYYEDFRLSVRLVREIAVSNGNVGLLIAVNPLNALAGLSIRRKNLCSKVLFISADYSKHRFGNFLLDAAYCSLDKFVSLRADMTGSVSTRIQRLRKHFGLPDEKNYFFPNTPPLAAFQKNDLTGKENAPPHTLVSVGSLSDQLSYDTMFETIRKLKDEYPDIILKIIGSGEKEEEYRKYVEQHGLGKHILFLGRMAHKDVLEQLAHSSIGLALYSGKWSFNYYGDSMKIREYCGFGLPVVTTDTHSTVDDIRMFEAGIIIDDTVHAFESALRSLFQAENYHRYSRGALEMSRKRIMSYRDFFERFFTN